MGGYLKNSDQIVSNTTSELDKILQSKASLFLSGLGDPVLVTWYNMNDSLSTADNGTETVDAIMGKDSPFRYNKIDGLPAYGIAKDMQNVELGMDDNGIMGYELEIEPVLLPNTIIPGPYDYMEYKFSNGRNVFFRANNVTVATVKSNGFYKVPMHMVDIDSEDYPVGIEEITVKNMRVNLDNVGSNEKCIISDTIYDVIEELTKLLRQTVSDYIDTFYVNRYNTFILREFDDSYTIYDPYLLRFITNHNLLDHYDELIQPVLVEQEDCFRADYNKTPFRAIELCNVGKLEHVTYEFSAFAKKFTNPFDYWGEETVYQIKVYLDEETSYPKRWYMDYSYLYRMKVIEESPSVTLMENLVIRYFHKESFDKFMTLDEIKSLYNILEMEYSDYYFYMVPVILYILIAYKDYLNNTYS